MRLDADHSHRGSEHFSSLAFCEKQEYVDTNRL
jgi:hypothetical protein